MHHFMCVQNQGFAWNDSQRGRFREDFFPPVLMPVVDTSPGVLRNMPIPPGIYEDVCKIIQPKSMPVSTAFELFLSISMVYRLEERRIAFAHRPQPRTPKRKSPFSTRVYLLIPSRSRNTSQVDLAPEFSISTSDTTSELSMNHRATIRLSRLHSVL